MLGVGLRVRLIVAAAPARPVPVPAPPGKAPFPLSSSVRRSFTHGHGRDTTTTTTSSSSRATRKRWWSDSRGSQEEEDDYEDEAAFSGFGWAGELFHESWFSKVSKTYGVILPVMLTSMFATTGLKAFLMAMAIPLSQAAISSFLLGRRKGNRDDCWRRPLLLFFKQRRPSQEEDYPEDATDFATADRAGNRYSSSSSSNNNNYYDGRRSRHNYQSWVSKDFADAASTAVGADDDNNKSSRGNKSSGGYRGWDELLDNNTGLLLNKRQRIPGTSRHHP